MSAPLIYAEGSRSLGAPGSPPTPPPHVSHPRPYHSSVLPAHDNASLAGLAVRERYKQYRAFGAIADLIHHYVVPLPLIGEGIKRPIIEITLQLSGGPIDY